MKAWKCNRYNVSEDEEMEIAGENISLA